MNKVITAPLTVGVVISAANVSRDAWNGEVLPEFSKDHPLAVSQEVANDIMDRFGRLPCWIKIEEVE